MNVRLFIAVLALAIIPAARAADEENPYKKAKVGDYATYKVVTKVGPLNIEGVMTDTVTATTDKEVTFKSNSKLSSGGMALPSLGEDPIFTIDLTKPYDPTKIGGMPLAPPGAEPKVELLKESKVKLKVAGKEYKAKLRTYKVKAKAGGTEFNADVKVWLALDLPIPTLRTEMTTELMGNKMEMTLELTESGTKKEK